MLQSQCRRLDVAIGIVGRPELLFLDEPAVGFDPEACREFHDLVHRLTDVDETTILLTTHDLDEAEKLADRVLILAGGRIMDAPDHVRRAMLRAERGISRRQLADALGVHPVSAARCGSELSYGVDLRVLVR